MSKKDELKNSPELIARLNTLLEERRYNAPSFAAAMGKSRQWGYAVMKNHITLSGDRIGQIAKLLGVTTDTLIYGEDISLIQEKLDRHIAEICDRRIEEKMAKYSKSN